MNSSTPKRLDTKALESPIDTRDAVDWLACSTLGDTPPENLFAELCDRLCSAGLPLLRCHLSMRMLHPLLQSVDITWRRGQEFEVVPRPYSLDPQPWLQSPLYWMINNGVLELYEDLTDPIIRNRFPVYADLAAKGATGYFAILTPFGDPETALVRHDGVITSWATDKADGFSPTHLDAIRGVIPHIALTARLAKSVYTARNVVNAYLGEDVGHRVLSGQIRLGDSQTIPAVIWYSDLRESTAMAERLGPEVFLRALNEYFECSAGAVLAHHGEVLRFVGDAVLAVFPISQTQDATEAAANACAAASEGRQRLQTLNVRRLAEHDEALDFGVALHIGDVLYGNIGVPTRIEFSVIGSAANEVCRMESLTKTLREPVVVSREFRAAHDIEYRHLGAHTLKGIGRSLEVFAPVFDATAQICDGCPSGRI